MPHHMHIEHFTQEVAFPGYYKIYKNFCDGITKGCEGLLASGLARCYLVST